MTALKFDTQAGYRLPNHSSITCCMLSDFHSDGGACSTGKVIESWQRLFSPGKKTVAVKTAMKRLGNRRDKIKKPLLAGYLHMKLQFDRKYNVLQVVFTLPKTVKDP